MMISGVGGGSNYYEQMAAIRNQERQRPNPFEEHDSNGDGSLDIDELGSFADKISEMTGEEVNAEEMLARLDTDEDGLVSESELEAGRPKGPPPSMPGGMDGAGMMSGSSGGIEMLLSMLGNSDDDSGESTTDSLDTNGDGIVDAQERKAAISELIQNYQSQNDSYMTQASLSGSLLNLQA